MEDWMVKLLKDIVTKMSPEIRQALIEFVNTLDKAALEIDNPWDDVAIGLLKVILLIE